MRILVTGCAGFIGMYVTQKLLSIGYCVIGVDNLNDYYDVGLKKHRLHFLLPNDNFEFYKLDIADNCSLARIFAEHSPDVVVHLAAQAGVRYSIKNPQAYSDANLHGFINILEGCRNSLVKHLVYASSSSVYGGNASIPYAEDQMVDSPLSLYAATKKANELMAHSYSYLYDLPTTGLRFFTVYGPMGRPDMAFFKFTKSILDNNPIHIYNNGEMVRDFTYIDDIVEGIIRVIHKPPKGSKCNREAISINNGINKVVPYSIFNIGNSTPVKLTDYICAIEKALSIEAKKIFMPMQPGDMRVTLADTTKLKNWVDFIPTTRIEEGIDKFVKWYLHYYKKELVIN